MKASNRIIFNTSVVYIQLLAGIIFGLISTRLVLNALGEVDYGIYALVAGIIGMLNILGSSMRNASMRFMAYSLGTGNKDAISSTFNTIFFLHFIIGGITILILEIGGWLMFKYLLNIPMEKIHDAKIVFHCMVATTFVTIIAVPFDAVINAHEDIIILSLTKILGYALNLIVAIIIFYISSNLLIVYGFLMMFNQILLRFIKQLYSRKKYEECKISFKKIKNKQLVKSIISYTSWTFFGSIATMITRQLKDVLINMFFGVKLNAATGVSQAASSKINLVAVGLTQAINPQLVKSEGANNRGKMRQLTFISTKYATYLFSLFAIPFIFEASSFLKLWLKNVPEYAEIFFQLSLLLILIDKLTFHIGDAIRAVGEIRNFQLMESFTIILGIPISIFIFKFGGGPTSIYLVNIVIYLFLAIIRLYYGNQKAGINIKEYMSESIYPIVLPIILSTLVTYVIMLYIDLGFMNPIIFLMLFIIILSISFWFLGVSSNEKLILKRIVMSLKEKLWKKS